MDWATQVFDMVGSEIGHGLPGYIPSHLALTVDCSSITKAGGLSSQLGPCGYRSLILISGSIQQGLGCSSHLCRNDNAFWSHTEDCYRKTSWLIAFGALIQQRCNPHKLSQKTILHKPASQCICMIRFPRTFSC